MQEVFEKIIAELEENQTIVFHLGGGKSKQSIDFVKAIEIINQAAAEYNNGWIPVGERLPEESLNSVLGWDEHRQRCCLVQYYGGRWILGNDDESIKIIAWRPLLPKYQPKGE